ncbi:hypothetical protein OJ998_06125 [Solirubrobacter taibaiensis]|nr:hypothetical protein [Solirubrobacter taibaiensis]
MNLRRHLNVLRRFRIIVAGGLILAIVLAILSIFNVSTAGLEWRSEQTFTSNSALNVTQQGFPDGRVVLAGEAKPETEPGAAPTEKDEGAQFADPGRFANLAVTYAYYAQSDAVRALISPAPPRERITITPAPAGWNTSTTLPILNLDTTGDTPEEAQKLNSAVIDALKGYIKAEQDKYDIPSDNRVRIDVLTPPSEATVLIGHSKTPALVAFLLVMAAALALSYCLDNLYPPKGGRSLEIAPESPAFNGNGNGNGNGADHRHTPATPPAPVIAAAQPPASGGGWSAPPASRRAG